MHEKVIAHTREERSSVRPNKKESYVSKRSSAKVESPERIRMREDVSDMRAKMLVAESAYLRAVRLGVKGRSAGLHKGRVNELRNAYDQARADFSNKVNESVSSRLSESGRGMAFTMQDEYGKDVTKKVARTQAQKEEVARRYNRMVLTRDTVDRAHRKRIEMLPERERNPFKKVLGWYARAKSRMESKIARLITRREYNYLPEVEKIQKQKTARKIARGLRILTFAGVGGIAGGLAATGSYIIRSIVGIFAGTYTAKYAGKHFMRNKGADRARRLASARENTGTSSAKSMRDLDLAYKKGSQESLRKSRSWREMFCAVIFGAGVSIGTTDMLSALPSMDAVESSVFRLQSASHGMSTSLTEEIHSANSAISYETEKLLTDVYKAGFSHAPHNAFDALPATSASHGAGGATGVAGALAKHSSAPPATPQGVAGGAVPEAPAHAEGGGSPVPVPASYQPGPDTAVAFPLATHTAPHGVNIVASHGATVAEHGAISPHTHIPQGMGAHMENISGAHIVNQLHSELGTYVNHPISEILYEKSIPQFSKVHEQMVAVVSNSGIGPSNNETVAHFLERAQEGIATNASHAEHIVGMHSLHIPIHQTHLYETVKGQLIAFGGDFNARSMIAYEYLSSHHGAHILLEGAHNTSAVDMSSTGSSIAERFGTSLRPGTFIPPAQFAQNIQP